MGSYNEIHGDLIELARRQYFDVIAHGVNCFCKQAKGLAPQMAEAFGTNDFKLEGKEYLGNPNKLGMIDYETRTVMHPVDHSQKSLLVVCNLYTQFRWATRLEPRPFDYQAFRSCCKQLNLFFRGDTIGLPAIGTNLAGGDWSLIKEIIQQELTDCHVVVVHYKP